MRQFKFWTLTQENTSPFIIIAVLYFLLLGSPFIYFLYLTGQPHYSEEYYMPEESETADAAVATKQKSKVEPDWRENAESSQFVLATRLAIFSAVLAFGAIGSAVSLITRARNKNEIGNITPLELISIQTIGAIFATILMLVFVADLIGGRLFPEPELFYRIIYVHAAFAKLLIWSFIAGFSERFVPNILNNIVKQVNDTREKEPEK